MSGEKDDQITNYKVFVFVINLVNLDVGDLT